MIRRGRGLCARRGGPRRLARLVSGVLAFAASLLGGAALAQADVPAGGAPVERLRVLTFNAFGIPVLSPAIDERMAAIVPAIAPLGVDVVLMQEVWRTRDAVTLSEQLRAAGFVSFRSFASDALSDRGRSGLFVASKLPITAESFEPFDAGLVPHIPWHVDWRGGKGFLVVRVATPVGDVALLVSHTQASYATGQYEAVRIAQVAQIAASLAGPGGASQVARPGDPLVLAGDLNASPSAPSIRLLEHLTGAEIASPELGLDLVLARNGASLRARFLGATAVLDEPVRLPSGAQVALSDHAGVLAEYAIEPCRAPCASPSGSAAAGAPDAAVVAAAVAEVDADARRTAWLQGGAAVGTVVSALLAVRSARGAGGPQRRRRLRAAAAAFSVWCLFWAAWWSYTTFVFAPAHLAILDRTRATLEAAGGVSGRHAPVTVEAPPPR